MTEADTITNNAKSNLAFTLVDLPEERRQNMARLYAFCRIVDDIVDEPGMTSEERHAALDRWVDIITCKAEPIPGIEVEVQKLMVELQLDPAPLLELIKGCRGDIAPQQPATRMELLDYAYKVAACVGISSAAVMGASPAAKDYAMALGYALQLVNILRDIAENPNRDADRVLSGLVPHSMVGVVMTRLGWSKGLKSHSVTKEQRRALIQLLKKFEISVRGVRPVSEAIVTAGGVKVGEVSPNTMESKLVSGLYFAGEVLDVDAYTGGFNLQIAWATGHLAGVSAAEK